MMMNREVKILINEIARELNINVIDVERIYEAPFDLQSIIMKYRCDRVKKIFPSLRIPYFLIFHCPDWNKKRLLKREQYNETIRSAE